MVCQAVGLEYAGFAAARPLAVIRPCARRKPLGLLHHLLKRRCWRLDSALRSANLSSALVVGGGQLACASLSPLLPLTLLLLQPLLPLPSRLGQVALRSTHDLIGEDRADAFDQLEGRDRSGAVTGEERSSVGDE